MLAMFSIAPLDKGESVSKYVAEIMDMIDKSGLDYQVTPMATIVEGEFDPVMDLIRSCHKKMRENSKRVITSIKIDDRDGATGRLSGKIEAVEEHLGRKLKK